MSAASAIEQTVLDAVTQGPGRAAGLVRRALRLRRTQLGLVLAVPVIFVAFFGEWLAPRSVTGFAGAPYSGTAGVLFGTDSEGRDVLSRVLAGGRLLVTVSLCGTLIGVGCGLLCGIVIGYTRGVVPTILARVLDVILVFPAVVLALLLLTRAGGQWWLLIIVIAVIYLPQTSRVVAAATRGVASTDYVKSAESLGVSSWRIMLDEIVPNISSVVLVELSLRFTIATGIASSLSFLGLGVQPPAADWGLMIQENQGGLTVQPWGVLLPVIAIVVLTLGTSLIADGMSRAAARIGTVGA